MSSNVIYLGHIPDGFVEMDMWNYFSQFGRLKKLKLFRSKKTGKSKGYAFVQYIDPDVAKIVAGTMNNYLMFEKIVKCHVVPKEKLHRNMFKNWRMLPQPKLLAEKCAAKHNSFKTDKKIIKMRQRLADQIKKQNQKLKEAGVDYSFPVTWAKVKAEIKEENEQQSDEEKSWLNKSDEIVSEYSMIVDSSEDEISLKTPENVLKKSKTKSKRSNSNKKEKTSQKPNAPSKMLLEKVKKRPKSAEKTLENDVKRSKRESKRSKEETFSEKPIVSRIFPKEKLTKNKSPKEKLKKNESPKEKLTKNKSPKEKLKKNKGPKKILMKNGRYFKTKKH